MPFTKIYKFDHTRNKVITHLACDFVDKNCPQYPSVIRKWGNWSKVNHNMTVDWLLRNAHYCLTKEEALKRGKLGIKYTIKRRKQDKKTFLGHLTRNEKIIVQLKQTLKRLILD